MRDLRNRTAFHAILAGLATLMVTFCLAPSALAVEGQCPNEPLRKEDNSTGLPDCRAYEMVEPPYTAAGAIGGGEAISPEGNHIIDGSDGSYAGATGAANEFSAYEYTRSSQGWETTSLEPPNAVFPDTEQGNGIESGKDIGAYKAASRNLGTTLFYLRKQSAAIFSYYLREPSRGLGCPPGSTVVEAATEDVCFVEVGPPSPIPLTGSGTENEPDELAGTSSDLSRVVFSVRAPTSTGNDSTKFTWPGDTTTSASTGALTYSLYEYVGTGQSEPKLVGVKNQRALAKNTEAELISNCGTALGTGIGSKAGEKYNAVSASGETIFFTAMSGTGCTTPVANELYARIGGAQTVSVSEPPLTVYGRECTGTCETDEMTEADRKAAIFQGASENGSKVFFLTEQPLVNGAVTTTQKKDLYEEEIEGGEVTSLVQVSHDPHAGQAAEVEGVARVSEDGSHVYFVAKGELASNKSSNGEEATEGADNLYVYERDANHLGGRLTFIADLCSASGKSGTYADSQCPATSTGDTTDWQETDSRPVQATPDGEYLVFESVAHLTPGDTSSTTDEVYEYDAHTGELVRVSVGQCPAAATSCSAGERYGDDGITGTATIEPLAFQLNDLATRAQSSLSLSENGTYVFFGSTEALAPGATAGVESVYEYHWSEGLNGDVYLIDSGINETVEGKSFSRPATLQGTTATADDVFFLNFGSNALVGQDTNTLGDIYDASIDGGFPAPSSSPDCEANATDEADDCQGALGTLFGQPSASGSATQKAGENLPSTTPVVTVTTGATLSVLSKKVKGDAVAVSVKTSAAGRVKVSGKYLTTTSKTVVAGAHTLTVHGAKGSGKAFKRHKKTTIEVTLTVGTTIVHKSVTVKL